MKKEIQMGYEKLTLRGFIKEIKEVSSGPHSRKFCFVLGAGASKSSGIKLGQDLVNKWEEELLERNENAHLAWKNQLGINDKNKYEFYSDYYERRFKKPIDGFNYLEKLMDSTNPSIGYVILAYILTHTNHNVVITTNFDHLLEDAINYYENKLPLVIGHESLAHYVTGIIDRPKIIKIHRDLLLNPKNRTSEINILHENWKNALNHVFSEYSPIFIGYAGNDHSLMDYLSQNKDLFSDEKVTIPYWMSYKTDKTSETVLDFLNESNGYLIEHNGFDEVMILLGNIFNYQLPTPDEFCNTVKKRYNKLADSMDAFSEILSNHNKINNNDNQMHEIPEVKQAIQSITSQTELQSLFEKAIAFVNAGKYLNAIKFFKDLIKKAPQNARYYSWLGIVLFKMGRYEEALKEIDKALKLDPNNAQYYNNLGVTLDEMGHHEEALKAIKKALEIEPDDVQCLDSLGVILNEMGYHEEALKTIKKALEIEPNNAECLNSLGTILHTMGDHEKALEAIEKALELEPNKWQCFDRLIMILHEMGRGEEAIEALERALELEPNNAMYHSNLGTILHEMGRDEEASEALEKALELEPNNALYHINLGMTLHAMGRDEEAKKVLRETPDLSPEDWAHIIRVGTESDNTK